MNIEHDFTYLTAQDRTAIAQGVATLAVHSIRLEQYVSEEDKKANFQKSKTYSTADWIAECAMIKKQLSEQNIAALTALENAGIVLGQYRSDYHDWITQPYDFWFWCRTDNGERMLDYVTLTVNSALNLEQQTDLVERATTVLEGVQANNIRAAIQHKAIYDEKKITEAAENFVDRNMGKFITNGYDDGKLVRIDPALNNDYCYAFMKKNAKTKGIRMDKHDIYALSLLNVA